MSLYGWLGGLSAGVRVAVTAKCLPLSEQFFRSCCPCSVTSLPELSRLSYRRKSVKPQSARCRLELYFEQATCRHAFIVRHGPPLLPASVKYLPGEIRAATRAALDRGQAVFCFISFDIPFVVIVFKSLDSWSQDASCVCPPDFKGLSLVL